MILNCASIGKFFIHKMSSEIVDTLLINFTKTIRAFKTLNQNYLPLKKILKVRQLKSV